MGVEHLLGRPWVPLTRKSRKAESREEERRQISSVATVVLLICSCFPFFLAS
jgi:hypothetical protein